MSAMRRDPPMRQEAVIDSRTTYWGYLAHFTHRPAGHYVIGAATRLEPETWGYYWTTPDGVQRSRRYADREEAWGAFLMVTKPVEGLR